MLIGKIQNFSWLVCFLILGTFLPSNKVITPNLFTLAASDSPQSSRTLPNITASPVPSKISKMSSFISSRDYSNSTPSTDDKIMQTPSFNKRHEHPYNRDINETPVPSKISNMSSFIRSRAPYASPTPSTAGKIMQTPSYNKRQELPYNRDCNEKPTKIRQDLLQSTLQSLSKSFQSAKNSIRGPHK